MRIICLLFFMMIPTLSSAAASFDCTKASTAIEKLICGSPQISRLDEELSVAYKEAATQTRDRDPLVIDQKRWLKNERGLCRDENCLKMVYQERIIELKRWNEPAPEEKDIFGNYSIQRDNFLYNPDKRTDEPVKTEDCLTLKPSKGNGIHFSFNLVGANGHTCSMEGEAVFTGSDYQSVPGVGDADAPKNCKLQIHIKRNTLALEDIDGACREYFCGARAVIDGTEFGRRQKVSKECKQWFQ
jgi:uncharacterized protein